MASWAALQVQMASAMEVLTRTALSEMIKLVEDAAAELRLEMSRSQRENEALKSRLLVMEGEGAPDSSLNIALEVKVCDEFRDAQNSHVAGKGSCVAVESVFGERLTAVLAQDEEHVPVQEKEAVTDSLDIKNESVDGVQVWSKSVLLSEDWLEEDLKMSQSQPGQKIFSETSCGSSGAANQGPACDEEEVHMQPCPAGEPEKGLRADLKQEPEWEGEQDYALPLLGSIDQGLEFSLGMVSEEHGQCGGSTRVEESFDDSVEAESTSRAATADAAVRPLCKEEAELLLQPSPARDPEKGLRTKLMQEQEGEPLTPGHPLPGSAEGFEVQCVRSKATRSGKVQEMPRRHRGSLEDGGVRSNDQFSPRHFRVSRRLRSEKNEGPTSHLEQQQNGRPNGPFDGISVEMVFPLGSGSAPCEASFDAVVEAKNPLGIEGREEFVCTCCGQMCPGALELQTHEVQHGKRFRCLECGKAFAHASSLRRHRLVHTGEKPHRCDKCGRRFTKLFHLKTHQTVHTGENLHSCDECGKSFTQLCGLKTHQRVHTGEKPHSCDECGKSFSQLSSLKTHRLVHTREKPHSCDECRRSFTHLCNLKTHQRLHTGEKPYICDECGKRFTHLVSLKAHQWAHTGYKPYICDECGKRFTRLDSLKTHQRLHTGRNCTAVTSMESGLPN